MKKKSIIPLLILIIAGLSLILGLFRSDKKEISFPDDEIISESETIEEEEPEELLGVHIIGAVKNPGVYYLSRSSRVSDAVKEAIPLDEANLEGINLAIHLEDSMQIRVPYLNDEIVAENDQHYDSSGKLNLNTATKNELMELPGIGEVYSKRILDYREEQGNFQKTEDLMKVSGIGSSVYNKCKDSIYVG